MASDNDKGLRYHCQTHDDQNTTFFVHFVPMDKTKLRLKISDKSGQ